MNATTRRLVTYLAIGIAAVALAGCASSEGDELLVAKLPADANSGGATVWAAGSDDELNDSHLVAEGVADTAGIATVQPDGDLWLNTMGRTWAGQTLLAYITQSDAKVTAGQPGGTQKVLASPIIAEPEVMARGLFAQTQNGCLIADDSLKAEEVGEGRCVISPTERYVISWGTAGGLRIRDLSTDETHTFADISVAGAAGLAHEDAVLVLVRADEGVQAVVYDGRDGTERGRSAVFPAAQVSPTTVESEAFVVQVQMADGQVGLLHVDSDGEATQIATGLFLHPVQNTDHVIYLDYAESPLDGRLMSWHEGDEPHELLAGNVGAGAVGPHDLIATRELDDSIEVFRMNHGTSELVKELEIPNAELDTANATLGSLPGLAVRRALRLGGYVHLALDTNAGGAYVRVDLGGHHSDAPIEGASALTLHALDSDGTALLSNVGDSTGSGGVGADAARTELMTIRLHDHDPDVRATLGTIGQSYIRAGQVYFSDRSDGASPSVRTVRGLGSDRKVQTLWDDVVLVGATWPQAGGATESDFVTYRRLAEQAQQAQAQAQQMQQAQQLPG